MALRRRQTAVFLALVLFFAALATWTTTQDPDRPGRLPLWLAPGRASEEASNAGSVALVVPELQQLAEHPPQPPLDDFCAQRFTARYLEDLRDHAMQYCAAAGTAGSSSAPATLTCYHAHVRADGGVDSFCLATGAVFRPDQRRPFALDCTVRAPDANETARGLVALERLVPYWEETGPRRLLDGFVEVAAGGGQKASRPEPADDDAAGDRSFLLLVKREGNHNLWHGLMELWSMASSFDVLRMSPDPDPDPAGPAGPAFRFPEDLEHTQVLVVDGDAAEEPNFDLWRLFAAQPVARLGDVLRDPARAAALAARRHRLVLPLAGASNPLWQNDWAVRDGAGCRAPPLLALFAQRVLGHYGVEGPGAEDSADGTGADIRLTFIERTGTRKLRHAPRLLAALRARYPHVAVRAVDLAALSFGEQLRLVHQQTDILAGVHGAGLTHTLFLREGAGAVVEIQPAGMGHVGFRNLAAMRGIKYFRAQAESVVPGGEEEEEEEPGQAAEAAEQPARRAAAPWQTSDVQIEEERFLALMDAAIKSLYNEGKRNRDVV